jgi:hypothetical protein
MHGVGNPPPSKATGFASGVSFIETTEHALKNRNTATATRILMGNPSFWDRPIITSTSLARVSSFAEIFFSFCGAERA